MKRLVAVCSVALLAAACGSLHDDNPECTADAPALTCAPDVTQACGNDVTALTIDAPVVCGDGLELNNNAPAGGFPVGETTVTFTATGDGVDESCTVTVTITDAVGPVIDCPADGDLVRTDPGEDVTAPGATATDNCTAGDIEVTPTPAVLSQGVNDIEYAATDGTGNTSTCHAEITIIDIFRVEGFRIISAQLSGGDTIVTLGWDQTEAADAIGYRIERAAAPGGPWTALDTVSLDTELYADTLPASEAYYRVVTVAGDQDGGATDPLRALQIADDLYDIRDVPVPNIPFNTTLYGVVRYPSDLAAGPYPLIIVLHGNHGNCRSTPGGDDDYCITTEDFDCGGDFTTPNAEGYIYFLETLAAQGFIAVSISGNAMNCRDDYIIERSNLIVEHLRRWSDWNTGATGPFGTAFNGALDLARTGLVGHSRGGDAVSNVPTVLMTEPAISGMTIKSIFAIAPTDFHDVTIPESNFAVLLPACDGDVSNLTGMDHYDRSRPLDDGARRAQVLFIGANHNYFNTEWKNNDNRFGWSCNVSAQVGNQAQMGMLEATLGAWFGATLFDTPLESWITADADTPTAIDAWANYDLDLRWSYSSDVRTLLDDFDGAGSPDTNDFGEANSLSGVWHDLTRHCYEGECVSRFNHEVFDWNLLWEQGNTPVVNIGIGGYDSSARSYLSFRVVSRRSSLNTDLEVQDFRIRLYDSDANVADFVLSDIKILKHLYPDHSVFEVLETVRIGLDDLLAINPDLDLTSLDLLEFEMTALDRSGSVVVTDFEFTD